MKAREYGAGGERWMVDVDLEQFFDRVNHDVLMARVARKPSDRAHRYGRACPRQPVGTLTPVEPRRHRPTGTSIPAATPVAAGLAHDHAARERVPTAAYGRSWRRPIAGLKRHGQSGRQ